MGLQLSSAHVFNSLVLASTIIGLGFEAAHAATHPPQPHTDQHERIEHRMTRLREAQQFEPQLRMKSRACGFKPPEPLLQPGFIAADRG